MRISIDVDLEPSEFPLANELLQTLRLLTEHVKVKRRPSGTGQAPAAPAQHAAPQPANGPVAHAAAAPPAAAPVAAPVAAPSAAAPLPQTPQEARQVFTQLISRLGQPEGAAQLDAVAAEAARVLGGSGPVPSASLVEEFNEALCGVAFDKANIQRQQSVDTYLSVLPRLPEAIRNSVKAKTIQWVLGFLNQKRPVDVDRESVYLQADGFAVLVQMDFVAADGTLQTMGKLVKTPEKRVAAVMTLCALVQRCRDKIASANPTFLESTMNMLVTHAAAEHRPAVEYIFGQLGRPLPPNMPPPAAGAPAAAPQAAAPPPQQQQPPPRPAAPTAAPMAAPLAAPDVTLPTAPQSVTAQFTTTCSSPANADATMASIFSLAYDPYSQLMMSGGLEVPVALWSADGRLQHQLPTPNGFFVSNIHVEPQNRLLIVVGAANAQNAPIKGRIGLYDARPGQGYANRGNVVRGDMRSLAGVDTIPNTPLMLVAELVDGPLPNRVAMYDYNRVMQSGDANQQPLQCFGGHTDVVTAVATAEREFKDCFLSGGKDNRVMVWDTRTPDRPVAILGVKEGEPRTTHTDMVTCVDVCGYSVMSASLDGSVALWDLRATDTSGTINAVAVAANNTPCIRRGVTEPWASAVVKAAMRGAPYDKLVAAATVRGLYLLDMSQPVPVARLVDNVGSNDPEGNFCEVKWCSTTGRLLAASGQSPSFEVLEIRV